jgi:site-specific DNA-methyltransferase (adenine-specific)
MTHDEAGPSVASSGSALADARAWLASLSGSDAAVVVYDPPYAVGTPVRGREDGAAGSVFAPFGFLHETLRAARATLRDGGVVLIFADWRRMADMGYMCSTVGLRPSTCIAWTRKRPGTGGIMRSAWDPILIASRGVPLAVDRAAVRNVIEADYPTKRRHPYEKPAKIFETIFPRVCKPGDLVLDPFAGSGVSGRVAQSLGLRWNGCDIDPAFAR